MKDEEWSEHRQDLILQYKNPLLIAFCLGPFIETFQPMCRRLVMRQNM